MTGKLVRQARRFAHFVFVLPVRFYQLVIGPLFPKVCKFEPSCSEYFIQSVQKYGPLRGAWRGAWRICRCNPWNHGGYDPP
jgi:putative membrane protein insertion efficiency factor